jgi:hypothetical protein
MIHLFECSEPGRNALGSAELVCASDLRFSVGDDADVCVRRGHGAGPRSEPRPVRTLLRVKVRFMGWEWSVGWGGLEFFVRDLAQRLLQGWSDSDLIRSVTAAKHLFEGRGGRSR